MKKDAAKKQARQYEVTYLVPANRTDSEVSAVRDAVSKLVTQHKGTILETEDWGKRTLAYKIRHNNAFQSEAVYVHLKVEMDADQAPALDRVLQLNQDIMRHLVVKAEE